MTGFGISFEGLDELKLKLDSKTINKNIGTQMGRAIMQIHGAIRFDIIKNYAYNKSNLDSVLVGGTRETSIAKPIQTTNVLSLGLVYNYKAIDLSKFPDPNNWAWGNINPGARQKGRVQSVSVKRGITKVVLGKDHRGGFVPRDKEGTLSRGYNGGAQMFERIGANRNHLRLLFGPSLSQMAASVVKQGSPELDKAMQNVTSLIAENIFND